jgi:hypothetical protein
MTRSTRTFTFTVNAPPAARKNQPGHYLAIGNGAGNGDRRGNYYKVVSGSKPDLLSTPGIRGVQLRYTWADLNPTGNTFNFGTVKATYPDTERTIRADLWRCRQSPHPNAKLIIMVEDRTFNGATIETTVNPMPADMANNSAYVRLVTTSSGGTSYGYTAIRWDPVVITRWHALITALGAAFDSDPNWYGIAFQESAGGWSDADRTQTNYSDIKYRDALINQLKKASDVFPTSRIFWYTNFFPTPAQDFRLEEVADAIKVYQGGFHGVIMGGPDILPDRGYLTNDNIWARCYPRYRDPPVGSFGELPLFCSMQLDSYAHNHVTAATAASPDPRMPGLPVATWTLGSRWTMDHLFRFGRDYLHLNYVMWDNRVGSGNDFEPDARLVIAANPTFNV